MQVEN